MKFMKGMLVGTLISAGVMYMMSENEGSKKKMIKKENNLQKKWECYNNIPIFSLRINIYCIYLINLYRICHHIYHSKLVLNLCMSPC